MPHARRAPLHDGAHRDDGRRAGRRRARDAARVERLPVPLPLLLGVVASASFATRGCRSENVHQEANDLARARGRRRRRRRPAAIEAMFNSTGTAYAQGTAIPKRFGVFFWGNGVRLDHWTPTNTGTAWTPSPSLAPLLAVKDYVNVVTGHVRADGQQARPPRGGRRASLSERRPADLGAAPELGVRVDVQRAQHRSGRHGRHRQDDALPASSRSASRSASTPSRARRCTTCHTTAPTARTRPSTARRPCSTASSAPTSWRQARRPIMPAMNVASVLKKRACSTPCWAISPVSK